MLVSIIIPIYKVEEYLARCIDSILAQTYEDWELILVDDGSPDKSGQICEEYAEKDDRICVLHKANGGPGSARNVGIEASRGDYIVFVDSDDWIGPNHLMDLVKASGNGVYDLVTQGFSCFSDHVYDEILLETREYIGINIHSMLLDIPLRFIGFPFGKLFKSSIIKEFKLRMDEEIRYGEDAVFILHYLAFINSIKVLEKTDYYYFSNEQSLSHLKKYNVETELKAFRATAVAIDVLQKKYDLSDIELAGNRYFFSGYLTRAIMGCKQDPDPYRRRRDFMKKLTEEDWRHYELAIANSGQSTKLLFFMEKCSLLHLHDFIENIRDNIISIGKKF